MGELNLVEERQIARAAQSLLASDIGAAVDPSVRKGRGIPLRYLSQNSEVAWERKIQGGRRIRTRAIGDCGYDDLSEFESCRKLSKDEKALITFVDADQMRMLFGD